MCYYRNGPAHYQTGTALVMVTGKSHSRIRHYLRSILCQNQVCSDVTNLSTTHSYYNLKGPRLVDADSESQNATC